jgi:hypothetical protein
MGKRTERDLNTPSLGVQTREKGSALVACNADEVVAGSEADPVEDRGLLTGFEGVGPASAFRLALVSPISFARSALEATTAEIICEWCWLQLARLERECTMKHASQYKRTRQPHVMGCPQSFRLTVALHPPKTV